MTLKNSQNESCKSTTANCESTRLVITAADSRAREKPFYQEMITVLDN